MNMLELAEEVQLANGDQATHAAEDVVEFAGGVQAFKDEGIVYVTALVDGVRQQVATFHQAAADQVIVSTVVAMLQEEG
jgi:hypothetical protein